MICLRVLSKCVKMVEIPVKSAHCVLQLRQSQQIFSSSLPGQNGRHFADDTFRCIFVNEKFCVLIKISLKFVPKAPIDSIFALVKIMAWRWIGLALNRRQAIIWTNADPLHWRTYVALGGDELNQPNKQMGDCQSIRSHLSYPLTVYCHQTRTV